MQGLKDIRLKAQQPHLDAAAKYTQEAVADAAGVTVQTYRSYEKNPEQMQISTARKVADYLGCSIEDFYLSRKGN
jgi:DNA-binding XRE family transcriptional regulator